MSKDIILTDEDGTKYSYDRIKTQGWLNGHPTGAEKVCDWLVDEAVKMFKDGRVEEATKLREMALKAKAKIVPELERAAEVHEKCYPEQIGAVGYDG